MASDAGTGRKRRDALIARMPQGVPLIGAEVGVWTGKFSERVLRALPLLTLYLVDRWAPPPEGDSYLGSGSKISGYPQEQYDKALASTFSLTAFAKERVKIFRMTTVQAALEMKLEGKRFDFVFIDGDHSYAGCMCDILAWRPLVKPGGWIGGHDFDHPDQGGVKDAVLRWLAGRPGLELDGNRTWWVRV